MEYSPGTNIVFMWSGVTSIGRCQELCQENSQCEFWTLADKCYLKGAGADATRGVHDIASSITSGPKFCPGPGKATILNAIIS